MRPCKKSQRSSHSDLCDHISNLPDCIISHILSRLDTRDAVRTCVLSKDWENKWNSIYRVDINEYKLSGLAQRREIQIPAFVTFVERVLLYSLKLRSFNLRCNYINASRRVESWISTALRHGVESLQVTYSKVGVILPRSLVNGCTLLKDLKLVMPCTYKVHGKIQYQNLTSLCLDGVMICNENRNTDTVEFTFPALENCELKRCNWLNVEFVKIYAPALSCFKSVTQKDAGVSDYSICIIGDTPADFYSSGGLPENITLTPSPFFASVEIPRGTSDLQLLESGVQFRKLLQGISAGEALDLTGYVVQGFARSKQGHPIPEYDNLKCLSVTSCCTTGALFDFFHAAPSLSYLSLHECNLFDTYDYSAVASVPSCIQSRLEQVEFHNFSGSAPELDLTKFILKNAIRLKKIYLRGEHINMDIVDQLAAVPKASTCLSIIVPCQTRGCND